MCITEAGIYVAYRLQMKGKKSFTSSALEACFQNRGHWHMKVHLVLHVKLFHRIGDRHISSSNHLNEYLYDYCRQYLWQYLRYISGKWHQPTSCFGTKSYCLYTQGKTIFDVTLLYVKYGFLHIALTHFYVHLLIKLSQQFSHPSLAEQ